jgi:hypothetical protein
LSFFNNGTRSGGISIWLDMAKVRETILLALFSMRAQKKSSAQIIGSTSLVKLDWLIAIFKRTSS